MEAFISFVILLAISVVVSAVLHYGLAYYVTAGHWSFASKVVVGWYGAWWGTPLFGEWWEGVAYGQVYIVPAVVGSVAILIVAVDVGKMCKGGR